ncbi:MAG TPA: T9SS type A sorting domain-containing protein [Bacteroidales bacterium]|nr:T9SS type A sorting domain-containing protein [Bacteroidales bacterium]
MKKHILLIVLAVLSLSRLAAQYATPGNSLTLTPENLVAMSGGVVTNIGGVYYINNTLTISPTDTLKITSPVVIRVAQNIRIEVGGTIKSDPDNGKVIFTAQDTTTAATNFRGFRFDNAQGNIFRNTVISYGGGIQLISSGALFEYCTFRRNGSSNVSGAISYSSCSPIIRYCLFEENARSAINSGANITGSPQIMYNVMIRNTTDNSNRPQINIGPGAADTIYIVGNYIEGFYEMAGGIGVSNLLGSGSAKVVVRDNFVVNNRYGYAQIGNNISSLIEDNYFIDNNIQGLPASGGSGINFQASGGGNTAIVRRNLIYGNLWGVTIQGTANPNFGTIQAGGGNVFFGNGNDGQVFALYNNTALPVQAVGNYWGTNDPAIAEQYIFHQPDQASLGLVTYLPLMQLNPVIESFAFLQADNPALGMDYYGVIDQNAKTIVVTLPAGSPLLLVPQIGIPFGTTTVPAGGELYHFSEPFVFQVLTPHGDLADYTVFVNLEASTYTVSFNVLDQNGQPITDAVLDFDGNIFPPGVYVVENVLPGTYNFSFTRTGFTTYYGTVVVVENNLMVNVTMQWTTVDVTFLVHGIAMPLQGAVVQVVGQPPVTTNELGIAIVPGLPYGQYTYTVFHNHYFPFEGSFTVNESSPTLIEVTMILTGSVEHTQTVQLFPNPFTETICIQGLKARISKAEILDLRGNKLIELTPDSNGSCLSVSGLSKGTYLVRILADGQLVTRLMVKQ